MTTQVTILPDGYIHVCNLNPPSYKVSLKHQFAIAHGKGHFDKGANTVWFDLGKLGKIPMPLIGEVHVKEAA